MWGAATRSAAGRWILAYLSEPGAVSIRLDAIEASRVRAQWIDLTNGHRTPAGVFETIDTPALTCPTGWQDAVLFVEATDQA
ncbi:MAG: hypothetical protein JW934_04700 [Anaerolineae bacterium]|nr:hypothetical protein [Anaerolineae bacterium]